jgi:hypothetical protein
MALSKLKLRKVREEQRIQDYQKSLKKHKQTYSKSLRKLVKRQTNNNKAVCFLYHKEKEKDFIDFVNHDESDKEIYQTAALIVKKGKTKNLFQEQYMIGAFIRVVEEKAYFIRPIEDWKPKGRTAEKLFASLLRHLFVKYPVPNCMYSLWFDVEDCDARTWFIDVAQGRNLSKINHFPVPVTKKEAHHFTKAPSKLTFIEALRYGQAITAGATMSFIKNLIQTDLGNYLYPNEEFWKEVITFLVRNNHTATAYQLEIVVEYIWNQKFVKRWGQNNEGEVVEKNPSEPNFDLKGKTWDSLWRRAFEWFEIVGFIRKTSQEWAHLMLENNHIKAKTGQSFVFEQLLTKQELFEEGKNMNHCVGSYSEECENSTSAIFSMQNTLSRGKSLVTVEVDPKKREIVQARCRFNDSTSYFEKEIIKEWARQNDLKVPSYY